MYILRINDCLSNATINSLQSILGHIDEFESDRSCADVAPEQQPRRLTLVFPLNRLIFNPFLLVVF